MIQRTQDHRPSNQPRDALASAKTTPYWLDSPLRPLPRPPLTKDESADLVVVGAGYTGMWTALLAKEADPARDVVVIDAGTIAWASSGRNGGFCEASLTHGSANGLERFPDEFDELERLGRNNLQAIQNAVRRYGIDCDLEVTGQLDVATQEYQVAELESESSFGTFLDSDQVRAEVASPTYLAGLWRPHTVLLNPAKLAWGLASAAESYGVRIYENTRATRLSSVGAAIKVSTTGPTLRASQVALGTNAFPSLLLSVRPYIVPVYDYALTTQPLSDSKLDSIGWRHRQGIGDTANQFHYYRLTADNRILFGGYDAVYYFGRKISRELDQRAETFELLANHLYVTFPQLDGVGFSHKWGGVIDLCARFCPFFGTGYEGRVAYAAGYTGLGVGATRFGAAVMLDLLAGARTERTKLQMVQSKPLPFPPEPLTWLGVTATHAAIRSADRNEGRRNLWLRSLDRLGMGFDS